MNDTLSSISLSFIVLLESPGLDYQILPPKDFWRLSYYKEEDSINYLFKTNIKANISIFIYYISIFVKDKKEIICIINIINFIMQGMPK